MDILREGVCGGDFEDAMLETKWADEFIEMIYANAEKRGFKRDESFLIIKNPNAPEKIAWVMTFWTD